LVYISLDDLDAGLWGNVVELYLSDPLTHCYLMYDLIYELGNIEAVFSVDGGYVESYVLLWRGSRVQGVHLWGRDVELLRRVRIDWSSRPSFIHLYTNSRGFAEEVLGAIGRDAEVLEFYDMAVDERDFKSYIGSAEIRRLGLEDLDSFIALKRIQGREVCREEAAKMILRGRYYGAYVDGILAAIAGRYIALPEVWVIGDVYVHPDYRGRGLGKAVTSAITRDAVASGAAALLHVDVNNAPAISLYKDLGYRILRKRIWIRIRPGDFEERS